MDYTRAKFNEIASAEYPGADAKMVRDRSGSAIGLVMDDGWWQQFLIMNNAWTWMGRYSVTFVNSELDSGRWRQAHE